MNADRIIVVENGQILEQGNHNDLIVAGGRYADLWSKQVFVRPSDEGKSTDDSIGQAGIVNDLSSEQTKTELSKVKATTVTEEAGESSQQNGNNEQNGDHVQEDDGHKHNGEGSLQKDQGKKQNGGQDDALSTPNHKQEVSFCYGG